MSRLFTKWIDTLIHAENYQIWAALVSLAIVIALSHWHEVWLPVGVHDWLTAQSEPVKVVIYSAGCVAVFLITSFAIFCAAENVTRSASR